MDLLSRSTPHLFLNARKCEHDSRAHRCTMRKSLFSMVVYVSCHSVIFSFSSCASKRQFPCFACTLFPPAPLPSSHKRGIVSPIFQISDEFLLLHSVSDRRPSFLLSLLLQRNNVKGLLLHWKLASFIFSSVYLVHLTSLRGKCNEGEYQKCFFLFNGVYFCNEKSFPQIL